MVDVGKLRRAAIAAMGAVLVPAASYAQGVDVPDLGITWSDYFTALTTTLGAIVGGALLLAFGLWAVRRGWAIIRGFVK